MTKAWSLFRGALSESTSHVSLNILGNQHCIIRNKIINIKRFRSSFICFCCKNQPSAQKKIQTGSKTRYTGAVCNSHMM